MRKRVEQSEIKSSQIVIFQDWKGVPRVRGGVRLRSPGKKLVPNPGSQSARGGLIVWDGSDVARHRSHFVRVAGIEIV